MFVYIVMDFEALVETFIGQKAPLRNRFCFGKPQLPKRSSRGVVVQVCQLFPLLSPNLKVKSEIKARDLIAKWIGGERCGGKVVKKGLTAHEYTYLQDLSFERTPVVIHDELRRLFLKILSKFKL